MVIDLAQNRGYLTTFKVTKYLVAFLFKLKKKIYSDRMILGENTMAVQDILCEWFEQKLPTIKHDYDWRVPIMSGFIPKYKTGYENTIALKTFLRNLWFESDDEEKLNVAKLIIGEWGGIKTNRTSTLEWYIQEVQLDDPETPLHGVSSFSKLYAVIKPEEFAIYDARVAVCLNSIQYNKNIKGGSIFNFTTSSRNAVIKKYFSMPEFKPKNLYENNLWFKMAKDDTYRAYVNLLKSCLRKFPGYKLYDLEMALFHYSIDECMEAMEKARTL